MNLKPIGAILVLAGILERQWLLAAVGVLAFMYKPAPNASTPGFGISLQDRTQFWFQDGSGTGPGPSGAPASIVPSFNISTLQLPS